MSSRGMKLGAALIVAIVLLMLPTVATANIQSGATVQIVATLGDNPELPSAPSSTRGS